MDAEFRQQLIDLGFEHCPGQRPELIIQWLYPDTGEDYEFEHYSICWYHDEWWSVNEISSKCPLNIDDVKDLLRLFGYADAPYKNDEALKWLDNMYKCGG